MKCANWIKVDDFENYVNTLFKIESESLDKDSKIAMLQFQLAIEKQLSRAFAGVFVPFV